MKDSIIRAVNTSEDDTQLLSVSQALERLGNISKATLYGLMNQNLLGYIHIGRRRFIPLGALREYVLKRWKESLA
ncbi:helix-turn-helix domain-containing protein [Streptomyces sp. NPDC051554]|uniref:helix-turn-helix domain-containing protein n=1 Tax=Streptomyces sp. NPDC051554 TaxID=3365656 RepID=UPI0037BD8A7C